MIDNRLTDIGKDIITRAIADGKQYPIQFTKIKIGDGYTKDSWNELTDLIQPVKELEIEVKKIDKDTITVKAMLSNQEIETGFFYRELGLFALDKVSGKEMLVSYGNAGDRAEYINDMNDATFKEKLITIIIKLENISEITVDVISGIYATQKNLDEVTTRLEDAIETKANQTEFKSHTGNTTLHITSTERTNWNDANEKKHVHTNKSVLDGITGSLVTAWNGAVTHISDTVKHITSTERTNWNDANEKKHVHTNKSVLDGITEPLVTAWNGAVTHISDTVKHITSTERTNWNSAKTKADSAVQTIQINGSTQTKTNGVVNLPAYPSSISGNAETATKLKTARKVGNASFDGSADISLSQIGAAATSHTHADYVNQNAFSNVTVGSTTIAADSATDTLTLTAGSNVTLTPDATNDKVTISATNTVYTHPSYTSKANGLYKVTVDGTGHISATSTVTKADITNLGIPAQDTNTTYGVATTGALGLIKSGTDITVDASGNVSVVDDSHNHIISNVDGLQSALDAKAASSHTHANYVNQNAFSNVTVGSTTIAADSATDSLTLAAGSNVTLTPDATNDKITISAIDTKYAHPTYTSKSSGLYKVTVDGTGHVSATNAVTKPDITNLGIAPNDSPVFINSISMGREKGTTVGYNSIAIGYQVEAIGNYSYAGGEGTVAPAASSHAEGKNTTASGEASHAEGNATLASGSYSHAEGATKTAESGFTEAQLIPTSAYGIGAHAEGLSTTAGQSGSNTIESGAHAEGICTIAKGPASHAEGDRTIANAFASHAEGLKSQSLFEYSHAEGRETIANAKYSHVEGWYSNTSGQTAHAEGSSTSASGKASHSEGDSTHASGNYSHAEGDTTQAIGEASHAEGISTSVSGKGAHVEGHKGTIIGDYAHGEGYNGTLMGEAAHVEGYGNSSFKKGAHAEGSSTEADGEGAHAEGYYTKALGNGAHVEGCMSGLEHFNLAHGEGAHAEGCDARAGTEETPARAAHAEGSYTEATGEASHAEGNYTKALGYASHAEGFTDDITKPTTAMGKGSHAEGYKTTAGTLDNNDKILASHAEGKGTAALGEAAHAEGDASHAEGRGSHSEGSGTLARGSASHAEGENTSAYGRATHAEGINTIANGNFSHAEGNITYSNGLASHSEGTGTYADGDFSHAEGCSCRAKAEYTHAEGYDTTASGLGAHAEGKETTASGEYSHAEGYLTNASGNSSHAEGRYSEAHGEGSHAEGYGTSSNERTVAYGKGSHAEGYKTTAGTQENNTSILAAHAEGFQTAATGAYSHAEGKLTTASGNYSHAEGNETIAEGLYSHAEGNKTAALGYYSHAEGVNTTASHDSAHAEGCETIASGYYSHTEGRETIAKGGKAHAEGSSTLAKGANSHSGGDSTIASSWSQTAIGRFNKDDGNADNTIGNYFIIGNGSSDTARSNCFRVTNYGAVYGLSAFQSSGADYAEYFEWLDGNLNNEDRVGYFVTMQGSKIIKAESNEDYILGIVSAQPCIIGNSDEDWLGRWKHDEFGRFLTREIDSDEVMGEEYIPNPDYDPNQSYIERKDRKEWSAIGMMGVLAVRDDGTCKVNGFCTVKEGGIATTTNDRNGYRVIERVTENIVKVVFR